MENVNETELKKKTFKKTLREYRAVIDKYDDNYRRSYLAREKVDEFDNKADGYLRAVLDFGILDKETAEDIFDDIIRGWIYSQLIKFWKMEGIVMEKYVEAEKYLLAKKEMEKQIKATQVKLFKKKFEKNIDDLNDNEIFGTSKKEVDCTENIVFRSLKHEAKPITVNWLTGDIWHYENEDAPLYDFKISAVRISIPEYNVVFYRHLENKKRFLRDFNYRQKFLKSVLCAFLFGIYLEIA